MYTKCTPVIPCVFVFLLRSGPVVMAHSLLEEFFPVGLKQALFPWEKVYSGFLLSSASAGRC